MNQRYLILILSLFIALGANVHPVGAVDCAVADTCMPMPGGAHSTGGHQDHCFCNLLSMPSVRTCRLEGFLEAFQSAVAPPVTKRPAFSAGVSPEVGRGRIPELVRGSLRRCLNKNDSPLSHPIYLQTMALLC